MGHILLTKPCSIRNKIFLSILFEIMYINFSVRFLTYLLSYDMNLTLKFTAQNEILNYVHSEYSFSKAGTMQYVQNFNRNIECHCLTPSIKNCHKINFKVLLELLTYSIND